MTSTPSGENARNGGGDGSGRSLFRRHEVKFELDVGAAAFLRDEVSSRLPRFEFRPGFSHTYITTVYFDTEDRKFYERARRHYDDNDKIRVKEYLYADDVDESTAPASTFAAQRVDGFSCALNCFVELKQRRGAVVTKKRLAVPKSGLEDFLRAKSDAFEVPREGLSAAEAEARSALVAHLESFRVRATSVITYRREVFQVDEDSLRVTFDDKIAVYRPPPGLYRSAQALTPATLGVPIRRFAKVITEIKCSAGDYPEWLQRALRDHSSKPLSKFTTSVSSLFRERPVSGPRDEKTADRSPADDSPVSGRDSGSALDDTQFFIKPIES